jgi:hypothetical protein
VTEVVRARGPVRLVRVDVLLEDAGLRPGLRDLASVSEAEEAINAKIYERVSQQTM